MGTFLGVHSSTGKGNEIQKLSRVSTGALTAFPVRLTSEHKCPCFELQGRTSQQKFLPVNGKELLLMFGNCCLGLKLWSCTSVLKPTTCTLDLHLPWCSAANLPRKFENHTLKLATLNVLPNCFN